ncbi:DUF2837 family protein [Paenibacillus sp. HB172176]|uniref:lipid II flippase family protein n=1 Tax=Paenibacillus sp. HB172176 TaxID=2493690 RepID=UPI00143BEA8E|nr:DUF2837 family protein [Paenibacillus sp. HB172176]
MQMMLAALFTFIIHLSETLTYSLRLAGVRMGKLAVSLSLTGIILLVSRTANMAQAPLTGNIIDYAKLHASFELVDPFRIIIGAASLGTLAAILLLPSASRAATRVIANLEASGSIPSMLRSFASVKRIRNARLHLRIPRLAMLSRLRVGGIPKRLILLNTTVTALYTIGVLAALLAASLTTEWSTTASQSSGLINGMATILFALLIDPQIGLLTDRVMKGERKLGALQKTFGLLMLSRLLGTILAQALLVPASHFILLIISIF